MEEKTQAVTFNDDSTISTEVGGKSIKLVPLTDMVKVKDGFESAKTEWEGKETKFNTDLAEANRVKDDFQTQLSQSNQAKLEAEAAKEQAESKYSDYDTVKGKVTEHEATIGSLNEDKGKLEKELEDRIRFNLIGNGAPEDAIKDKPLSELRNLESAAKLFGKGNGGKPANYDGAGGGGGNAPETALERANRIIADAEARQGRTMQTSNTGVK